MTDKTKKIIAREGLVIIGMALIGCAVIATAGLFTKSEPTGIEHGPWEKYQSQKQRPSLEEIDQAVSNEGKETYRLSEVMKAGEREARVKSMGFSVLLLGYPFYLLARFIIWAVRTLREQ